MKYNQQHSLTKEVQKSHYDFIEQNLTYDDYQSLTTAFFSEENTEIDYMPCSTIGITLRRYYHNVKQRTKFHYRNNSLEAKKYFMNEIWDDYKTQMGSDNKPKKNNSFQKALESYILNDAPGLVTTLIKILLLLKVDFENIIEIVKQEYTTSIPSSNFVVHAILHEIEHGNRLNCETEELNETYDTFVQELVNYKKQNTSKFNSAFVEQWETFVMNHHNVIEDEIIEAMKLCTVVKNNDYLDEFALTESYGNKLITFKNTIYNPKLNKEIKDGLKKYINKFVFIKDVMNLDSTQYTDYPSVSEKVVCMKKNFKKVKKLLSNNENDAVALLNQYILRNEQILNTTFIDDTILKKALESNQQLNNMYIHDVFAFLDYNYEFDTTNADAIYHFVDQKRTLRGEDKKELTDQLVSAFVYLSNAIAEELVKHEIPLMDEFDKYLKKTESKNIKNYKKQKDVFYKLVEKYIVQKDNRYVLTSKFIKDMKSKPASTVKAPTLEFDDHLVHTIFRNEIQRFNEILQIIYKKLFLNYMDYLLQSIGNEDDSLRLLFESKVQEQRIKFHFLMDYFDADVHMFMDSLRLTQETNAIFQHINKRITTSIENYTKLNVPYYSWMFLVTEFNNLAYYQLKETIRGYLYNHLENKRLVNNKFVTEFFVRAIINANSLSMTDQRKMQEIIPLNQLQGLIHGLQQSLTLEIDTTFTLRNQFIKKINTTFDELGFAPLKETRPLHNFILLSLAYNHPLLFYCGVLNE